MVFWLPARIISSLIISEVDWPHLRTERHNPGFSAARYRDAARRCCDRAAKASPGVLVPLPSPGASPSMLIASPHGPTACCPSAVPSALSARPASRLVARGRPSRPARPAKPGEHPARPNQPAVHDVIGTPTARYDL